MGTRERNRLEQIEGQLASLSIQSREIKLVWERVNKARIEAAQAQAVLIEERETLLQGQLLLMPAMAS